MLVYTAFPYDPGHACELKNHTQVNKHFRLALHSHKAEFSKRFLGKKLVEDIIVF